MAIGYTSGYIRKKVGDKVYYTNQNVSGKVKQVWRAYQSEVANPKTARQSNQRSLFVAAKNFRRGFESLLNHSWQGKKYGVQSLNRFSQLVLANKGANYPGFFLQPKNSQKFIPQPWPLSTGSIAGAPVPTLLDNTTKTGISLQNQQPSTFGELSQSIIDANSALKDGDMITICIVLADDLSKGTLATFIPVYDRIVLDVTSSTPVDPEEPVNMDGGVLKLLLEEYSVFNSISVSAVNYNDFLAHAAIGVIVSRRSTSGNSWERSTSTMVVASAVADAFNNTEYVNNCIATFMDESMLTSDWYLNQVGQDTTNPPGGGGGGANSYEQGSVTLANSQTLANALIATIGGVRKPVANGTGASKACVIYSSGGWQFTVGQNLLPSATDAWTLSEFNAAFPDVNIQVVEQP